MHSVRIYLLSVMVFILSTSILLSQDNTSGSSGNTQKELIENFISALEAQGESAIIQALESGDVDVKVICLKVLASSGDASNEDLVNIINNYITYGYNVSGLSADVALSSWKVREEAINAAAAIKSPSSIEPLSSVMIEEQNPTVSLAAIRALGEIAEPQASAPLLTYLYINNSPNIVNEIVLALGKIGNPDSLTALINVVQNNMYSLTIKNNAVDAIKQLKQTSSNE